MQAPEALGREAQRKMQDQEIDNSLARIQQKLLIMSGKGGVGKSCISVSIAVGLSELGYKVGLMDVDLHGPSIPQMLGLPNIHEQGKVPLLKKPQGMISFANGKIIPAQYSKNLSAVSIECVLENIDSAVIWRGPLKITAIRQFIADVQWDDLDYLIIDSPPGTGDEPLTVAQTIPDAKAIIVTTPQAVSLRDVRKSINFCRDVNMKIMGLIENMSGFMCPECGKRIDLFKTGGGEKTAREMNVLFLGKIPIIPEVVEACDIGIPAIDMSNTLGEAFGHILDAITGKKQDNKNEKNALKEIK